ncbi:tRNA preQ1(34) S-adenosylmethionine ribosyltransferase-isomerase QueA [Aureimonas jatrophae]|uniref:S-adenosylmethionine:tRNA ribosyltransferase-isomerase n=1 Tax=Aureimonas jatrophae TaxID=1166073 RepID=A0A1H0MFE1_9HYPH|nr:tRNA preQ1(34) S-adenosylmethionine ribosyltransferase-isomerase QueA [Aureimonas jatrophae]SDO79148.1 S-adenosylmethionine:tRNA ribosyltransferase-isomerase [Aureimonas jatrophae]
MRVDLFDFDLPEERIALRPALPRESAKLLFVPSSGPLADWHVRDLPDLLRPDDVIVLNDTRVIPAQLHGTRRRGDAVAKVDVTLHMRTAPDIWQAFVRPAKKLAIGETVEFGDGQLVAHVGSKGEAGEVELRFDRTGPDLDAAVAVVGVLPLPPYIASRRPVDAADASDYQTSFAREPGAVAAPTAGLHMTHALRDELAGRGIAAEFVTLHVGAGTFLPVKADNTSEHRMHSEIGIVDSDVAARLTAYRRAGRRIVAIGTTSLRLLESAASEDGSIQAFSGATDIFITPGYRFRAVDALLTNFHLPRSTLFMLVSAFRGRDRMQAAYRHAIGAEYRFYSYGDACLLERKDLP